MTPRLLTLVSILAAACVLTPAAEAQNWWFVNAVGNDWNTGSNWTFGESPHPSFDVEAIVGSTELGAAPTADVTASGTIDAPTTVLGDGNDAHGALTIPAGSTFSTVADLSDADFIVGRSGGAGVLNVGGTLNVAGSLKSQNDTGESHVNLASGASVTVGNLFLERSLRVEPGVTFQATTPDVDGNGAILGQFGTHTWVIPQAGHTVLNVAGNADINGRLHLEFSGVTPSIGDHWDLIDAASIDAIEDFPTGFSSVTSSLDGFLTPGQRFSVAAVNGAGSNGAVARATFEQHPVLVVNRQSGEVALANEGSTDSIGIDSYSISSPSGSLVPGEFSGGYPLAQGWYDANLSENAISELNPLGSDSLSGDTDMDLGELFELAAPAAFGVENEDLRFRYSKPGGGFIEGQVVYEGLPNNTLVLRVDPGTGDTELVNPSPFSVDIDSYIIRSPSGSIIEAEWDSLQEQGIDGGDWYEANPKQTVLSELLTSGGSTLGSDLATTLDLGSPWDESGARDLEFQFTLEGESFYRTGKVVYANAAPPADLPGDYNNDTVVDAADYTVWRDALGTSTTLPNDTTPGEVTAADYAVWRSNYGMSQGASLVLAVQSAPEPTAAALLVATMLAFAGCRGRMASR